MDPKLKEAACAGDVDFLKRAVSSTPQNGYSYFLTQFTPKNEDATLAGNIYHLATWKRKVEFVREARKILPIEINQKLFSQPDKDGWTPLHMAAGLDSSNVSVEIVRIILSFYRSLNNNIVSSSSIEKPWLAVTPRKCTPLHLAIEHPKHPNEASAMEILSMDFELLCNMLDGDGNSPLFLAVQNGCDQVAVNILMSSCSYSLRGKDGSTPLHFAPKCSENVLRLLLKKHPELIDVVDDRGYNVLHQWVEIMKSVWPFDLLLKGDFPTARNKVFKDLILGVTENKKGSNSPLHIIAAKNKNTNIAQALINGYRDVVNEETKILDDMFSGATLPPWRKQNRNGSTPLQVALSSKNEQLALYFLSIDPSLSKIVDNKGESTLLAAVTSGCTQVIQELLRNHNISFNMLHSNDGTTVLHRLRFVSENVGQMLLEKYWWMISLANDYGRTPLDEVKEANIPWLKNLLMKPSSLTQKEPFDWSLACKEEETWAILAFIDNCQDLQKVCREKNDTPLHHIKLETYEEYMNLLKKPSIAELKNATDAEGATPLHRALKRNDILFAKALLVDDGVETSIVDKDGKTAMSLLADLCQVNEEWDKMCKEIKINPQLKITYLNSKTNIDQMRSTLSVVAALVTTITFAAGFSLPGGTNDDNGDAIMARKAAFLVFLLADAYAMCASILVLFCLVWSTVPDHDKSFLLLDRSVHILVQALYGTMLAFTAGIYSVTEHNSLWVAIVIFVMCTLVGVSANEKVIHTSLAKLIPTSATTQYQTKENTTSRKDNSWISLARGTSSRKPLLHSSSSLEMTYDANPTNNQVEEDQIRWLEEGLALQK